MASICQRQAIAFFATTSVIVFETNFVALSAWLQLHYSYVPRSILVAFFNFGVLSHNFDLLKVFSFLPDMEGEGWCPSSVPLGARIARLA